MSAPREEDYIAYHGKAWLKDAIDGHRTGMRLKFTLQQEEDYEKFKSFKKRRKGKAGSGQYRVFYRASSDESEFGQPIDLLFVSWSMSSSNGAVVTFQIESRSQWQEFRRAPAIDDGIDPLGLCPYEMMFVELDDSGGPINVAQRDKLERMQAKRKWPKGGPQSIRAARLCGHTDFINYLQSQRGLFVGKDPTPAEVAEWMRKKIKIDTRAQLDHDDMALARFNTEIMSPFLRWSQ